MHARILSRVVELLSRSEVFKLSRMEGASEEEIARLEAIVGESLPRAYVEFLGLMARNSDRLFGFDMYTVAHVSEVADNRDFAIRMLKEVGTDSLLPDRAFIFSTHEGYVVYYFLLGTGDDPETYYIMEDGNPPQPLGTFSHYLETLIRQDEQAILEAEARARQREEAKRNS